LDENSVYVGDFIRVTNAVAAKNDGDVVTLTEGGEAKTNDVGLVTVTVGGEAKTNDVGLVTLTVGGEDEMHAVRNIDPDELTNMSFWLALELTQAAPQSCWLNDPAFENMLSMLVTLDTSHFEISRLNDDAP
jgi:hypothetical protein